LPTALDPRRRSPGPPLLVVKEDTQLTQIDGIEWDIRGVTFRGKVETEGSGIEVPTPMLSPGLIQYQISLLLRAIIRAVFELEPSSPSLHLHINLYRFQIPRGIDLGQDIK
jgi:hypothetical protein